MPCVQAGDDPPVNGSGGEGGHPDIPTYAVGERTNKKAGHFRPSHWFPVDPAARIADDWEEPAIVRLSDGSEMEGLGGIVRTPELYSVAVTGKISPEQESWVVKRFRLQTMLIWGLNKDGGVVLVTSDMDDLADGLRLKRVRENYPSAESANQNKTPTWVTPSIWLELAQLTMTALTRGKENQKWCKQYASLDGPGAPWAKCKRSKNAKKRKAPAASGAAARNVRVMQQPAISEKQAKARAANAAVARAAKKAVTMDQQKLQGILRAHLSVMMRSTQVLDMTRVLDVPDEELPRFSPFRTFTATTSEDIDEMLSAPRPGVVGRPFPAVKSSAPPDVLTGKALYEMGLMVGKSPIGPGRPTRKLFHADFIQINAALVAEGLPNLGAERFLREIQTYLNDEDCDTEKDD